ncbi:MAG: 6-phosphofructokinase [Firmicutes bacterium ADurb.Bin300]|nr:MAG: 6-phosphofructokinase [Firmicutes bacterium ADurb.Bin300]
MNAAIRAVFKEGMARGYAVMGIYHGYKGLIEGSVRQLHHSDVENIMHKGGTILRTARSAEFMRPDGMQKALDVIRAYNMDGLVVVGGDGSFRGVKALSDAGIRAVGIPGTIDNDMGYTDFTIGFDTAINNVMAEIYKIKDTMLSHDRVGIIEVMGRACGDIALWAGVAAAADIIIVPEIPLPWEKVAEQLTVNKIKGKKTSIVMISEGAGKASDLVKYLCENTDIESKSVVLGYIQRGGNPTAHDRIIAVRMGARAVELIDEGKTGRAVGIKENRVIDVDIAEAVSTPDRLDAKLYAVNATLAKF